MREKRLELACACAAAFAFSSLAVFSGAVLVAALFIRD
jgi:hypothetical protein